MAHLAADIRAAEYWRDNSNISPARFTMTGRLQVSQVPVSSYHNTQPLDFSTAMPHSPHRPLSAVSPAAVRHEDAVDLTTRGRSGGEESSCSSVASDVKPCSPGYQHEPMPPAFPSIFKKSPSMTRPFKAYPKDPLNLPIGLMGGLGSAESLLSQASNEAYVEFRRQMLAQVVAAKIRRSPESSLAVGLELHSSQPEEAGSPQHPSSSNMDPSAAGGVGKDQFYWERRRKNNEAAKRSRDARRAKEDEIAIRAAFLEQENIKLKYEVAALRNETTRLRCLLYTEPS